MSNNSNNWKIDFTNLSGQATRYTYIYFDTTSSFVNLCVCKYYRFASPPGFATSVAAITSSTSSSKGNLVDKYSYSEKKTFLKF